MQRQGYKSTRQDYNWQNKNKNFKESAGFPIQRKKVNRSEESFIQQFNKVLKQSCWRQQKNMSNVVLCDAELLAHNLTARLNNPKKFPHFNPIKIEKLIYYDKIFTRKWEKQQSQYEPLSLKFKNVEEENNHEQMVSALQQLQDYYKGQHHNPPSLFNRYHFCDLYKAIQTIEIKYDHYGQNEMEECQTILQIEKSDKFSIAKYTSNTHHNPWKKFKQERESYEITVGDIEQKLFQFSIGLTSSQQSSKKTYCQIYNAVPKGTQLEKKMRITENNHFNHPSIVINYNLYIQIGSKCSIWAKILPSQIKKVYVNKSKLDKKTKVFFLHLKQYPQYFIQITDSKTYVNPSEISFWHTATDFTNLQQINKLSQSSAFRNKNSVIKIECSENFQKSFKNNNIEVIENEISQVNDPKTLDQKRVDFIFDFLMKLDLTEVAEQQLLQVKLKLQQIRLDILLSIRNNVQRQVITQIQKFIQEHQQNKNSFQFIERVYEYLHISENYLPYVIKKRKKSKKAKKDDLNKVFSISLTPFGIKIRSFSNEFGNRVFRKFDHRYFIRVNICDNDGSPLRVKSDDFDSNFLMQRVLGTYLRKGIQICGHHYSIIGWTNSQIKKSQVWFILDDQKINKNIKNEVYHFLGNFDSISSPSVRGVRIGQGFSASSNFNINPKEIQIETIPDLEAFVNKSGRIFKFCFSDGIGLISQNLLIKIVQKLELSKFPEQICSVQIRYLGFKGVLSLGNLHEENKIQFRESMKKYECSSEQAREYLDVLNWNKYCPGFINEQIIFLLEALKVPHQKLISKVEGYLQQIFSLEFQSASKIIQFFRSHLDYTPSNEDPLFELILHLFFNNKQILQGEYFFEEMKKSITRTMNNKAKNNMKIKIDDSTRLMGILDTYDILKQNQVFCRIKKSHVFDYETVSSKAFMTKNPCLHPGDIRAVICVSEQQVQKRLKQKKFIGNEFLKFVNVIVLPQENKNGYPLSSMISGGDLDGDYYLLCWDKDIYPHFAQCYPPNVYDSGQEVLNKQLKAKPLQILQQTNQNIIQTNISKAQSQRDLIDFFILHLRKQNLSYVTKIYKQLVNVYSAEHKFCKQLAHIHSKALDFSKKGVYEQIPKQILDHYEKVQGQFHPEGLKAKITSKGKQIAFLKGKMPSKFEYFQWASKVCFQFSNAQIQKANDIIINYKNQLQTILKEKNKQWSSELIFYSGRDQEYVADSLTIRKKYQDLFFDDDTTYDEEILYHETKFNDLDKMTFSNNAYRRAYLWYVISHCTLINQRRKSRFSKQTNPNIDHLYMKALIYVSKKNDINPNKVQPKHFDNWIGITWHSIPKIMISLISKAKKGHFSRQTTQKQSYQQEQKIENKEMCLKILDLISFPSVEEYHQKQTNPEVVELQKKDSQSGEGSLKIEKSISLTAN